MDILNVFVSIVLFPEFVAIILFQAFAEIVEKICDISLRINPPSLLLCELDSLAHGHMLLVHEPSAHGGTCSMFTSDTMDQYILTI